MSVTLPASYDLRLYRGDDFLCGFIYAEVDPETRESTMTTADGWTARAQVRSSIGGDIWLDLTLGEGLSARLNEDKFLEIAMHVPGSVTAEDGWACQTEGVWDLEVSSPEGVRTTVFGGRFFLRLDVTRSAA